MEKAKKSNGKIKKIDLSWIVVSDFEKAKKFFIDTLGLKAGQCDDNMGWLELSGHDGGAVLGIAKASNHCPIGPGQNAITTFTVDNIESFTSDMSKKGIKLIGDLQVIPEHVKMQLFSDLDGNLFQVVETLDGHNKQ
ncbi:MAG: VOC family protein [Parachlamydiaceae bacterium]|nr:VOC family protein [Parachlamydiaceae bacterium]